MKIHRISIKDFRGVAECSVELPETGVTVIEGENEVGKSSLIEAIFLLIDTPDSSNAAAVRSVRPNHTGRNPVVSAELSCGDYRFVYEKCYAARASERYTRLTIIEPRREQLTGAEAHERVARILSDTTDEALWRALRLQQGVEVKQEQLLTGSSLGAALDAVAGAAPGGGREDTLFDRITTEYGDYFTKTGQDRDTLKNPREADVKAAAAVVELERQLADLERDADRCDALIAELAHLRPQEFEQRELVEKLDAEWAQVAKQKEKVDKLDAAAELAGSRFAAASQAWAQREQVIAAVFSTGEQVSRLTEDRDRVAPAADAGRQEVEASERDLAAQRGLRSDAQAAQALRSADEIFIRDRGDLERMQERLKNIEEALPIVDENEAFLESCKIDEKSLVQVEDAHLVLVQARTRLEAAAPAIRIEALAGFVLAIDGEERELEPGHVIDVDGTPGVTLRVADLAAVTVTAGYDASQLREQLLVAESDFRQLTDSLGVASLPGAQAQVRRREQAGERLEAAQKLIFQNRGDLTVESLRAKVERTRSRVVDYPAKRSAKVPIPATLDEARQLRESAVREVELCDKAVNSAEKALADLRKRAEELNLEHQGAGILVETVNQQLAALTVALAAARQENSDEALQANVGTRQSLVDDAGRLHADALARLQEADPGTLEIRRRNTSGALDRCQSDIRDRENEHTGLRATLRLRGEEGLADRLSSAQSEAERCRSERESVERRGAAARLLFEIMSRQRDEARRAYIKPFRDRLESLGKIVFGQSLTVELSENLQVASRTLHGITVDYKDLSTGAKEQIGVLSRLVCAALVSTQGGVPLIVDDALGWSDPRRLERLGAAFTQSAGDCQIIVLTCTPDRYRQVGCATVVRLS